MFSKTRRNSCTRASKNKNIRFYEADNLCKNVKTRFNDVVQQRPVRVGLNAIHWLRATSKPLFHISSLFQKNNNPKEIQSISGRNLSKDNQEND